MGDTVLKISVTVGDTLFEKDLEDDLKISRSTLNDDCIKQPSLFAWYSVLTENAKDERDRAKERISFVKAEVDAEVRESMTSAGEKITEGKVEQAIQRHEKYREAVESHLGAAHVCGILYAAQSAVSHRKEMLVTLAANMRHEIYGEVEISDPTESTGKVDTKSLRERVSELQEDK